MRVQTGFPGTAFLPAMLIAGLAVGVFGAEIVRPPYPEMDIQTRTFTARIPTHWEAHEVGRIRDKTKSSFVISDSKAPIDKYYRRGEHPGRIHIDILLIGSFDGRFPLPPGAAGPGKALEVPGVRGQEWIHTSASPHLLGKIRTVLIVLGKDLYSLSYFLPTDTEQNGVIDRVIASMKPKKNVPTR